eukprot:XP_001691882.1 predicted protein [Chlamydomonas reinhardtii]
MRFHTVGRGSTSLLGRALEADDEGDAPPADVGCGGLAGALARRQRSALVALACPDLPPSALSGRGLHLQAQQRARCALGRHERACVSGYRPHLRAAATARAVMAVHAGLATDEAAEARERQEVENLQKEHQIWERLLKAAKEYAVANRELDAASDKDNKRASKLRKLGEALKAVIAAVEAIDYTDVLNELMQQTPCGPVAEARQSITACGSMLVLAKPAVPYEELAAAHATTVLGRHVEQLGRVEVSFLPAGLSQQGHQAAAADLAVGLSRYWGRAVSGAAGAGGAGVAAGGSTGAQSPSGAEAASEVLLCPEVMVLATVVWAAQALVLRVIGDDDGAAGATGVLAAVTRPAVLLRVARVFSSELLFRTPGGLATFLFRTALQYLFSMPLATAVENLHSSGKDAAAVAAATAAAAAGAEGAQQQLMERLRPLYVSERDGIRAGVKRQEKEVQDTAARLLGGSLAASQAVAVSPGGRAAAELAQLREEQFKMIRTESWSRLAQRLTDAIFNAPWPAAVAAAAGADEAPAAVRDGGAVRAPAAALAPVPAPPPTPVLMLPHRARVDVELRGAGHDARSGKASEAQLRALFHWAGQESMSREALARAMLGALAPCWEANMGCTSCGAAAPCTSSLTACDPTYSPGPHSSLVLQGSPAICYSLARTAAVNYVLDRVARGMAAMQVAFEVHDDASNATGSADADADTPHPASTASAGGDSGGTVTRDALIFANKLQAQLPRYQRAVGWPLVVTLSSSEEERAEHARRMPADLLMELPPLRTEPDIPGLLQQRACLVATWAAHQRPCSQPDQRSPGPETGVEPPDAAGASAAAQAPSPAGDCSAAGFQEAVSKAISAAPQVPLAAGSDDTMAAFAVRRLDSELQRRPLRAAWLQPANGEQTTAAAVALAEHSHRLRANAAAPRELVVVPLLDDAALRDSDIAQHLDGIACLVLRALSEALTFLEDEEPTAEVEEAAAAKDEDAGLGYMYTCRVQHMHWQYHLPLALNRALCRLAGVPFDLIGWTLSDLSQTLAAGPGGCEAAQEGEKLLKLQMQVVDANRKFVDHLFMRMEGFIEACSRQPPQAMAQAVQATLEPLKQLCGALNDIINVSDSDVDEAGDAEEGAGRSVGSRIMAPDIFGDLVPSADARHHYGGALGAYDWDRKRTSKQALQLLVAEVAPGRPAELLAGTQAYQAMDDLD